MIGPLVSCRDDKNHVVFHEGLDVDVLALFRAFDQCKLYRARKQSLQHLVSVAATCCDPNFRLSFEKAGCKVG